ncbi:vesicle-associated protein 2-1-like [Wolffia australiana]
MATETNGECNGGRLFSLYPSELTFEPEPGKSSSCDIKVVNTTEHYVAFKVKTTAPRKYFVRPNKGVVQPWDSQTIQIIHQAAERFPDDKDKFLVLSTVVGPTVDFDELPPNTFNGGRRIEEQKLGVVCKGRTPRDVEPVFATNPFSSRNPDSSVIDLERRLKEELDAALGYNQQLRRELDEVKNARRKNEGFSFQFAVLVGFVSLMMGLILNLLST